MHADGDVLDTGNVWDVGGDMETTTDGDGIRLILTPFTGLGVDVLDEVLVSLEGGIASNRFHPAVEENVRADLEVVAVVVEVLEVLSDGQEVGH